MSDDDRGLILATLAGDESAFGELVRRHQDRLYNTVYRLLGNAEDAQDVVQEAFLSAYQSLEAFKGEAQFFTWLYRIAVNAAISLKRKRRPGLSLEAARDGTPGADPEDPSEEVRPGRNLERQEDVLQLRRALERLSPEHQAVLILKELQGQKYEEMAAILGVPIGTIRSRLHRARLELRAVLEEEEGRPAPGPTGRPADPTP